MKSPFVVVAFATSAVQSHSNVMMRRNIPGHRNITAVEHGGPAIEGVRGQRHVVSATVDACQRFAIARCLELALTTSSVCGYPGEYPRDRNEHQDDMRYRCRMVRLYKLISIHSRDLVELDRLTQEGNIVLNVGVTETLLVWESTKCRNARENRVGLSIGQYSKLSRATLLTNLGAAIAGQ